MPAESLIAERGQLKMDLIANTGRRNIVLYLLELCCTTKDKGMAMRRRLKTSVSTSCGVFAAFYYEAIHM